MTHMPPDRVIKTLAVPVKKAANERQATFVLSTDAVDRDRDTISVSGWKLDNYLKNPVVLFAHAAYQPPIGKAVSLQVSANALEATVEFADKETYEFADTIFRLVKGGFLNAVSVGFAPLKWVYNEDRGGYDFLEQELREFSVVPVPSNPEALVAAKAAGIDVDLMSGWAQQALTGIEPGGVWLPKAAAERLLRGDDVDAVARSVRQRLSKAGRVLSAANEERLRAARSSADAVCVVLDEVLSQVEAEEAAAQAVVKAEAWSVDPNAFRAQVKTVVHDAVRARVSRALGRLD